MYILQEMEKQVKAGRTRSIGLSNFNESQIRNILDHSDIKPSNLQAIILIHYRTDEINHNFNNQMVLIGRVTCIHAATATQRVL